MPVDNTLHVQILIDRAQSVVQPELASFVSKLVTQDIQAAESQGST